MPPCAAGVHDRLNVSQPELKGDRCLVGVISPAAEDLDRRASSRLSCQCLPLTPFQGCVVLRPQQNYVYVLSHYLNSLVRRVVLVLCLTTVLLAVGTTARIFIFLLYLIRSY